MAKTKKRVPKELTRKQVSRLEREKRLRRIITWGVGIVAVLVVGLMGYGMIYEWVIKARQPVAVVAGDPITTAEFQARVRFARQQLQRDLVNLRYQQASIDPNAEGSEFYLEYISGQLSELESTLAEENALRLGGQVLDQMVNEKLVRQEAQRRGITVTAEELQREVERIFGYDRDPATPAPTVEPTAPLTPTEVLTAQPTVEPLPTPTPMTEESFQELYNAQIEDLKSINISERQYRSWIEASILQERLREALHAEVSEEMEQVQSRYFAVDSEELANEVAERLSAGEPFETLDAELRANEDVTGYGVDLGWLPRSLMEGRIGEVLAALAFNREVGSITEPLLGPQGEYYYVLEILARDVQPLSEDARGQLAEQSFQQWLDEQRMEVEYNDYYDLVPTEP